MFLELDEDEPFISENDISNSYEEPGQKHQHCKFRSRSGSSSSSRNDEASPDATPPPANGRAHRLSQGWVWERKKIDLENVVTQYNSWKFSKLCS